MTEEEAIGIARAVRERAKTVALDSLWRISDPGIVHMIDHDPDTVLVKQLEALGVIKLEGQTTKIGDDGTNPDTLPPRLYIGADADRFYCLDTAKVVASLAEEGFEIRRKA